MEITELEVVPLEVDEESTTNLWSGHQEEVLSSITHDLRAPLCAIMGYLDLVDRQVGKSAPPKATEYLTLAREAGKRMHQMVDDMLDMFRLENHQEPLRVKKQLASPLLQSVYKTFAGLADLKKISLICDVSDRLFVWADPRYLSRVLDNLVANAIKFTGPGGTIRISANNEAHRTTFEVADTGRGIPPDHLRSIFEKFQHSRVSDSHKGYGLGLAVVKTILKAHGGNIQVLSQVGQGSRFIFWLPHPKPIAY